MTQANEAFLDQLIKNQYKAAQEMAVTVFIHATLAVITFLTLPLLLQGTTLKDFDKLAGVLGGSVFGGLGYTPAKEILDRREKARNLEAARPLLKEVQQSATTGITDEQKRIKEAFLKLIEKTIST